MIKNNNYICYITLLSIYFAMIPLHALDQHKLNSYREKFSDVLLIINFNHPYYDNIEFIKNLYSPMFEHIVFYGEAAHPAVTKVFTHTGYFLSEVIDDALTHYPNFKGYLVLQDDCVLNIWHYLSYDLDKIWLAVKFNHDPQRFGSIRNVNGTYTGNYSGWWQTQWGFKPVWEAYTKFNTQELNYIRSNVGQNNIPNIVCDFFYIPGRLRESALKVNATLRPVFCEIAVPTMLCALDFIENWEQLTMHWAYNPRRESYPPHVSWVHPLKFSQKDNREKVSQLFNQMLS